MHKHIAPVLLATFSSAVWANVSNADIAVAPRESGVAAEALAAAAPNDSRLSLALNIPFSKLASTVNQFVFTFHEKSEPNAFPQYDVTIQVDRVKVSASPSTPSRGFLVEAPVRLSGSAPLISLPATATVTADLAIGIGFDDKNWCPLVEVKSLDIELAGGGLFSSIIKQRVRTALEQMLSCESVRSAIGQSWHTFDLPVQMGGSTLFSRFSPGTISLTEVEIINDRLRFKVEVAGQTSISSKQPGPVTKQLPAPKQLNGAQFGSTDVEAGVAGNLGLASP